MNEPQHAFHAATSASSRRSVGQFVVARALWYVKAGTAELRTERLEAPGPGELRIATEYSAVSRGTERLVAHGDIPQSEWTRMRAPHQAGHFPFPVKYGYSATGVITAGPEPLVGRRAFALHPHQDHFQLPEAGTVILPEGVPTKRATLAANMETALNAHWDAGTRPGDRVLVVGAGIVGLLTAYLANRIAGTSAALVDIEPSRGKEAAALQIPFFLPEEAPRDNTVVFHTSANAAGLQTAIDRAAFEATIVEMSWYGTKTVNVNLGGAFHSRRLKLVSSQVGHVAPSRRATVAHRDRLATAVALLHDPALDCLVSHEISFDALPEELPRIWSQGAATLPPVIRYRHS